MALTPIATRDDIKEFGGFTGTNLDALIDSLMGPCLTAIGNFCNRDFTAVTTTEYRDGNEASRMLLAHYPIAQITRVQIDQSIITVSTSGSNGYFFIPRGRTVILVGNRYGRGLRNIQIDLTAGYGDGIKPGGGDINPWPEDLKLAYMMYITTRIKERSRLGIGSQSLAGQSISYTDGPSGTSSGSQGIPAAARTILENYVNTVPENGL